MISIIFRTHYFLNVSQWDFYLLHHQYYLSFLSGFLLNGFTVDLIVSFEYFNNQKKKMKTGREKNKNPRCGTVHKKKTLFSVLILFDRIFVLDFFLFFFDNDHIYAQAAQRKYSRVTDNKTTVVLEVHAHTKVPYQENVLRCYDMFLLRYVCCSFIFSTFCAGADEL